ncbi:MAG: MarR family transcriptional regulator [Actinomycetes bacterium]
MARTTVADAELSSVLRLGVMRLARRLRLERSESGLTLTQLSALGTLNRHGPCTPGELAAHEKVQPPSMTRVLSHLEERGLVARAAHPTDRRQVLVALTDDARALVAEDRRRREAWLVEHLADLTADEREALRAAVPVLERLANAR